MISKEEKRKRKSDALAMVRNHFGSKYPMVKVADRDCFQRSDGMLFNVYEFPGEDALVVEYAENEEDAKKYRFEDGDRFYLDELSGDKLLNAMLEEINA